MQDQTQKSTIQWYLDLLNMDLDALSLGEKMKLNSDAIMIYYGMGPCLFGEDCENLFPSNRSLVLIDRAGNRETPEKTVGDWLKEDKLTRTQQRLQTSFSNILQNYHAARDQIIKTGSSFFKMGNSLFLEEVNFENINIRIWSLIWEPPLYLELPRDESPKKNSTKLTVGAVSTETSIYLEALANAPIIISFQAPTVEETLQIYFYRELLKTSLDFFKKCSECGNWFIHTSKRKRLFCTPQCAMRKANRDRRKSIKDHDPDEYKKELVEGRKRAKKSYRKKTKK